MTGTKRCRTCGEVKSLTEFNTVTATGGGHRAHCRACLRAKRQAEYRAGASWRSKDTVYEQLLKREYGITLDDYNAKLRSQAGRCAICRRPESVRSRRTGEVRRLAVDHDHVTKAVRGLLCNRCNILVWALEDNHTTLDAIRVYIEAFRETFAKGAPL